MRIRAILACTLLLPLGIHCGSSNNQTSEATATVTATTPAPPTGTGTSPPMTYAYYYSDDTNCGSVFGVPAGGGSPAMVVPMACNEYGRSPVYAFAFDAANVYISTPTGSLGAYSVQTKGYVHLYDAPDGGGSYVEAIASDGSHVYYALRVGPGDEIHAVGVAGGAPTLVASAPGAVAGIALDESYVYWTEDDGTLSDAGVFTGAVKRAPLAGGTVEVLADRLSSPGPIAVDSTGVYWIDRGQITDCGLLNNGGAWLHGSLEHLAPGSTTPVVLASELTDALSVARAGGAVYWTVWEYSCNYLAYSGSVFKLKDGSGTSSAIARSLAAPSNLFVDATTAYFTDTDSSGTTVGGGVPR